MADPIRYYDLERYLLEDVRPRFQSEHSLGAFDFFSIVIWKANRAKSLIARRLLRHDRLHRTALEPIVRDLTLSLYQAANPEERLRLLLRDWGLALPMASAILTILWPNEFSVYDVRVCDRLKRFRELANRTDFATIWSGYRDYLEAVKAATPGNLSFRDIDRYLWGISVAEQLRGDIERLFEKPRSA